MGIVTRAGLSRGTRTPSRQTSRAATSTSTPGRTLPLTEHSGGISACLVQRHSSPTEQLPSKRREQEGSSLLSLWTLSSVMSVDARVRHELVFTPTRGPISANDLLAYSSVVSTGDSIIITVDFHYNAPYVGALIFHDHGKRTENKEMAFGNGKMQFQTENHGKQLFSREKQ